MNILYHHRTQAGGVEGVHIREMVRAWEGQGHHVDVVGPPGVSIYEAHGKEQAVEQYAGIWNRSYRKISRYLPELFFELLEMVYNLPAWRRLTQSCKQRSYQLLYERYAIFNWAGIRAARLHGVPVILEVNYTARTPLYRRRSWMLEPWAWRLERYIFQEASGIVVVSSYLRKHLLKVYGISGDKVIVLPNAADPRRFSPDVDEKPLRSKLKLEGKIVIGFVGGFYPWHRLDFFCSALAVLKKHGKDIMALLIGNGPQKSQIKKLVVKHGIKDQVIFLDTVNHHDLPDYLAVFDVAVMPHSNEYGSPMKIFEYMAMGIPVVAPRLGPIMDGIDDEVEGLLFKPTDSQSLANALGRLIENGPLRRAMGRAGRERVIVRHNWMTNARAVIQFLESLQKQRQFSWRK